MAKRDLHHSSIMVGRKGTGKSTKLAVIAAKYPASKKVLIIDVNGSPAYNNFERIEISKLKHLKSGKVKLLGTPSDSDLEFIAENFRDGLVIFEDCTKYIESSPSRAIKTFLVDHRMYRCDLIFTFHSLKRIPPFFFEMTSYITLCKTQEQIEGARNKNIIPNYENVIKAWNKVQTNPNPYYSLTVETFV